MGTRNFLVLKIQFDNIRQCLLNSTFYINMIGVVVTSLWEFFWAYAFYLFGFITRYLFRLVENEQKNYDRNRSNFHGGEDKGCDNSYSSISSRGKKYDVFSSKDANDYVEEPNSMSFTVQELFDAHEEEYWKRKFESFSRNDINGILEEEPNKLFLLQQHVETEDFAAKENILLITEELKESIRYDKSFLQVVETEDFLAKEKELAESEEKEELKESTSYYYDKAFLLQRIETEDFVAKENGLSTASIVGPESEELRESTSCYDKALLSQRVETEDFVAKENGLSTASSVGAESEERKESTSYYDKALLSQRVETEDFAAKETGLSTASIVGAESEEVKESTSYDKAFSQHVEAEDFVARENGLSTASIQRVETEDFADREKGPIVGAESEDVEDMEESSITYEFGNESSEEEEEYIEIEPKRGELFGGKEEKGSALEWGHDDVIEQLRSELRSARSGGLATILEEEEEDPPPENEASLRPIMEIKNIKFGYKDKIEDIHKVHNIYAQRMTKLDILNTQTMHALGLLQLKDRFKSTTPKQNFVPIKPQKQSDPSKQLKYGAKLQNDFELVYVGQICLSWEILQWQHRSVRDLLRNDIDQPCRRFNSVASEFQLFQVLIQRFIEDESFRGPRVQNYVNNRCVIRSLMQVPVVRDDCVKDKKHIVEGNEDSVFVENLDKIIVEAMFTFGEFVRRDKKNMNSKVSQHSLIEPGDTKLLMDIRKEFQKKERRVKEIQRSGNCVMKKLQKNQEQGQLFQHALLLAQVELRLVSRVLSMSSLTRDQLVWCQQKLNQISFANKKVHLETSFLLIPC